MQDQGFQPKKVYGSETIGPRTKMLASNWMESESETFKILNCVTSEGMQANG